MPPQAFFVPTADGYRLALHHLPAAPARAALLLLPALAEEMNKLRRPLAHAAQAFAAAGFAVLSLDLKGSGDSSGDFADASWPAWQQDARLGLQLLRERHPGLPILGWGTRMGCLLASELGAELQGQLWWQPAPQGKALLQQFLRIRLAAEMAAGRKLQMAELRAPLQAGQPVWVGGYALSQGLAEGLEAARLQPPTGPTLWLEAQNEAEPTLLPASQNLLASWAGAPVEARAVCGPQAWAATELEDCDALAAASLAWLQTQWPAPA